MSLLLKNGTVLDYVSNLEETMDILIENGRIFKLGKNLTEGADEILDCTGLYIMPGMIDMHCHLRETGFEH